MCKYQQTNYNCGKHIKTHVFLGSCVQVANARLEQEKARAAAAAARLTAENPTSSDTEGKKPPSSKTESKKKAIESAVETALSKTATITKGSFWSSRKARDADDRARERGLEEVIRTCDPLNQGSGARIRQVRDDGGKCPICAMEELRIGDADATAEQGVRAGKGGEVEEERDGGCGSAS